MGIQREPADFVRSLPLRKGFSVCELGNQEMCGEVKHQPAEPFYRSLGCGRYVSIDGNGRAHVTADLNQPLRMLDAFDLVTDFGTGEHIFDQAQVWRTLHALTKPGDGYIVFDRPTQGYERHAFYLITEALILDIAEANDYAVLCLQQTPMPRGTLLRGVLRRLTDAPFKVPLQRRYHSDLVIPR